MQQAGPSLLLRTLPSFRRLRVCLLFLLNPQFHSFQVPEELAVHALREPKIDLPGFFDPVAVLLVASVVRGCVAALRHWERTTKTANIECLPITRHFYDQSLIIFTGNLLTSQSL
jgi:hypothetical protein